MNDGLEILCIEIRSIANALYFEQCSNDSFRQQFQACVRSTVQKALECHQINSIANGDGDEDEDENIHIGGTNTVSYDAKVLQNVLFYSVEEYGYPTPSQMQQERGKLEISDTMNMTHESQARARGIDWQSLCSSHDANYRRIARQNHSSASASAYATSVSTSTALETVIDALLDVSIIPACCTSVIVRGLLAVCIEVFSSAASLISSSSGLESSQKTTNIRTNRPQSLKAIEIAITYLIQSRPSAMMSKSIGGYIRRQVMANMSYRRNMKEPMEMAVAKKNDRELIQYLRQVLAHYNAERTLMIFSIAKDLVSMKETRDRRGRWQGQGQRREIRRIPIKHHLSSEMVLVRPAMCLLKELDEVDIYLLKKKQQYSGSKHRRGELCMKCKRQLKLTSANSSDNTERRKRIKTATLADLHGEVSDEEGTAGTKPHSVGRYFVRGNGTQSSSSSSLSVLLPSTRKQIMALSTESASQPSGESCYVCSRTKNGMAKYAASGITVLPLGMVHLRASLYQIIIDAAKSWSLGFGGHLHLGTGTPKGNLASINIHINPMVFITNISVQYPQSASIRLCVLLIADQLGIEHGYLTYLRSMLRIFKQCACEGSPQRGSCRELAATCLRIYHEVVKECVIFDDVGHFWKALQPLMELAFDLNINTNSLNSKHLSDLILPHIGLLLMERRRQSIALKDEASDEICRSFNGYVLRFSEYFGDWKQWVNSKMTLVERSRVLFVLQRVGIISFLLDQTEPEEIESNTNKAEAHENHSSFVTFSILHSLRACHFRMGPKVRCDQLLTEKVGYEDEDNLPRRGSKRDREDDIPCGDPIMDHINDDIIREILSFLGYKKLVQVTTICKTWHRLGNENLLWKQHYQKRFRPVFLEQLMPQSINPALRCAFITRYSQQHNWRWRDLFREKRTREKALKGKTTKDGWQYQGCNVMNCKVTIRKKSDIEKHAQVHQRDVMKKIEVIQRAEDRRVQRLRTKAEIETKKSRINKN